MKCCPACKQTFGDEMEFCGVDGTALEPKVQDDVKPDPLIGQTIKGRYRITKKLGEGGMGAVYLAQQASIGRKVALKLLHGAYSTNHEFIARFRREAHLAASLNHRNIVTIHDFDQEEDGSLFIVMEYVDGQSLSEVIRRDGSLVIGRAVRLGLQTAEGLGAAHRAGVIHRDIKPDNIMIVGSGGDEEVKLMDFGIARLRDREAGTQLTETGRIMGTPSYMAPEQIEGGEISERTDIYALGIVLYEMLSGVAPFRAPTPRGVLIKHLIEAPASLRKLRREIPLSVEKMVMQALEKKPEARQSKMEELAQGLRQAEATLVEARLSSGQNSMGSSATTKDHQRSWLRWPRLSMKVSISFTVGMLAVLVFGHLLRNELSKESAVSDSRLTQPRMGEKYVPPSPEQREVTRSGGSPLPQVSEHQRRVPHVQGFPLKSGEARIEGSQGTLSFDNAKIQDHLKIAKFYRERGDYSDALAELQKARTLDPSNAEVRAESENVRKACIAERDTLKRTDLHCP